MVERSRKVESRAVLSSSPCRPSKPVRMGLRRSAIPTLNGWKVQVRACVGTYAFSAGELQLEARVEP